MSSDLRAVIGAVGAEELAELRGEVRAAANERRGTPRPFVTIARQAGAGGRSLAHHLAGLLNDQLDPDDEPRWRAYDRELVEKIAADHGMAMSLIRMLEEQSVHWLRDLLGGLSFEGPSDTAVFHRAVATIRALAQRGRVVLVGRGSVFITGAMAGGVHVHLIAPRPYRVKQLQRAFNLSLADADREVKRVDAARAAFYRSFFPTRTFDELAFDVTFNTARLNEPAMAQAIAPLVHARAAAASPMLTA